MPSGVSRVLDLCAEISGGRNRPNVVGVCASIVRTRVGLAASRPAPELLADTCEREGRNLTLLTSSGVTGIVGLEGLYEVRIRHALGVRLLSPCETPPADIREA